jgi:hypothetical protein
MYRDGFPFHYTADQCRTYSHVKYGQPIRPAGAELDDLIKSEMLKHIGMSYELAWSRIRSMPEHADLCARYAQESIVKGKR